MRDPFSFRRNLSAKILLVTLAAVLTVMSLAELVIFLAERSGQVREMETRARITAARLAYNLADPLFRMNDPDIQRTISHEMKNREVLAIILDGETGGRVAARISADACPLPHLDPAVNESVLASARLRADQPIISGARRIGTVHLYLSDIELRETIRKRAVDSVNHTILFSVVFSAGLFLCLRRVIIRPLTTLEASVGRVSRGDFGVSIPVSSQDEVGRLGESFNRMVGRLQQLYGEVRESEKRIRSLSDWQREAIEAERKRIAREIHDDLSQQLTALRLDLHWIGRRLLPGQPGIAEKVQSMIGDVDQTHEVIEHIIRELRPQILDDLGLVPAIEWLAREFEKRSGVPVDLACGPGEIAPTPEQATALFRIAQESLTNVARHAEAGLVGIRIRGRFHFMRMEIRDDGKGFDPKAGTGESSHGLMGISERVRLAGGRLRIRSAPGTGTTISVLIPSRTEGESA